MTDANWGEALVGLLAVLATIYGTIVGKRGEKRGQDIEARANIGADYHLLQQDLWGELKRQKAKIAAQDGTIAAQTTRLDHLEDEQRKADRRYQAAVTYIRSLLAFITLHVPGHEAPKPPIDLELD